MKDLVDPIVRFKVSTGQKVRPKMMALPEAKLRHVDHVRDDTYRVSVQAEYFPQVLGRHYDLTREAEPGMNEKPPSREMILGLTATVVDQHTLAERPADEERWNNGEEERPVGCRENMYDVGL